MTVPDKIYAGDTLEFSVRVPDFPPSDGWELVYRFVPRFTTPVQAPIQLLATAIDATDYLVGQIPDVTEHWVPGVYGWARWVQKPGVRVTLDDLESHGQLEILQNPETAAQGSDNRSLAMRALDEARQAFANASTRAKDAGLAGIPVEYRIADRSMKYDTASEAIGGLLRSINFWTTEVNREDRAKRRAAGLPDPRFFRVGAGRG